MYYLGGVHTAFGWENRRQVGCCATHPLPQSSTTTIVTVWSKTGVVVYRCIAKTTVYCNHSTPYSSIAQVIG